MQMSTYSRVSMYLSALLLIIAAVTAKADGPMHILPSTPDALVIKNVAMVPIEPLSAILGWTLAPIGDNRSNDYLVKSGTHFLLFGLDSTIAMNGNEQITLPHAPFTAQNAMYVPLRVLVEALGCTLSVTNQTATVSTPDRQTSLRIPLQMVADVKTAKWGYNIYAHLPDSKTFERITYHGPINEGSPSWTGGLGTPPSFTPDGSTFVYSRNGNIYLRHYLDPNESILLACEMKANHYYRAATFSPDGKYILYEERPYNADWWEDGHIYRMRADGNGRELLAGGTGPVYSPDGHTIAFSSYTQKDNETFIKMMNADGHNARIIGKGWAPAFSPDGKALKFSCSYKAAERAYYMFAIYIISGPNAGTTYEPAVNERKIDEYYGSWSPDGQRIVFTRMRFFENGKYLNPKTHKMTMSYRSLESLEIMNRDRSECRHLYSPAHWPAFSVDGTRIYFNSAESSERITHIYSVNTDGSDRQEIARDIIGYYYSYTPDKQTLMVMSY